MTGAAVLACQGAIRSGAGLVTLLTRTDARVRLAALPPEVMVVEPGLEDVVTDRTRLALARFAAILAGPGLGGGRALEPEVSTWLQDLWAHDARAMVFDADALPCAGAAGGGPRVITPHPGEASRQLGIPTTTLQSDRIDAVQRLTAHGVALLKGPFTLIGAPDQRISVNPTGGPVLATAGSGDVLAGVIGGLLARGCTARDAARIGAWVHGTAADLLARSAADGWVASDVATRIPDAMRALVEPSRG